MFHGEAKLSTAADGGERRRDGGTARSGGGGRTPAVGDLHGKGEGRMSAGVGGGG